MKEVESYGQEGVEVMLIGNKCDVKEEDGVRKEAGQVKRYLKANLLKENRNMQRIKAWNSLNAVRRQRKVSQTLSYC